MNWSRYFSIRLVEDKCSGGGVTRTDLIPVHLGAVSRLGLPILRLWTKNLPATLSLKSCGISSKCLPVYSDADEIIGGYDMNFYIQPFPNDSVVPVKTVGKVS